MTSQVRRALSLVTGVAALLVAGPAAAGAPTEQLRTQVGRVLEVLDSPALRAESRAAERRAELRRLAGEIFDFAEMTRRSMGPHWTARTAAERREMVQLFTDLLERSYLAKIDLYSGERIAWTGETLDGDQATVRTRIITRQGSEIPVDYRMLRRGERWLAYDVVIEGVSLVANYRTQFNKIIQGSSYAELVKRLRDKAQAPPEPAEPRLRRTSRP